MGPPGGLKEAERALNQFDARHAKDDNDRFEIAEVRIAENSPLAEQSLAETRFRQTYGVTLLGIRRGQEQITTIAPTERLRGGDCLIVIGASETVKALKGKEPI